MDTSDLAKRMKNYESVSKTRLMNRTPVAIRLDGRSFHTFTRKFQRPFDKVMMLSMQRTMKDLCQNTPGCVLGYTQSDEISLILVDYKKLETQPFFDNEVQKICSVTASMATLYFNREFSNLVGDLKQASSRYGIAAKLGITYENLDELKSLIEGYEKAEASGATFDSRIFNIPKEEVTNLIYWRQLDASRNSIQMVGQSKFSHKELQNKSCSNIQDMLMERFNINWNDFSTAEKRGSCCIKAEDGWKIDTEIPIFKCENRAYIDNLIFIGD